MRIPWGPGRPCAGPCGREKGQCGTGRERGWAPGCIEGGLGCDTAGGSWRDGTAAGPGWMAGGQRGAGCGPGGGPGAVPGTAPADGSHWGRCIQCCAGDSGFTLPVDPVRCGKTVGLCGDRGDPCALLVSRCSCHSIHLERRGLRSARQRAARAIDRQLRADLRGDP